MFLVVLLADVNQRVDDRQHQIVVVKMHREIAIARNQTLGTCHR